MRRQGIADLSKITTADVDAYLVLLRRTDNGRAFLKIMRGFELTRAKRDLYVGLLRSRAFPVQIIWGEADPALKVTTFGEIARRAAGLDHIHQLPGKHFLQRSVAGAGRVDHRAGPAVISCPGTRSGDRSASESNQVACRWGKNTSGHVHPPGQGVPGCPAVMASL
jgi:pimeloyl-ACP methyl ester carboxylesterase